MNESGNYTVESSDVPLSSDIDPDTCSFDSSPATREGAAEQNLKRWKLNYHEAAIYLQVRSYQRLVCDKNKRPLQLFHIYFSFVTLCPGVNTRT